MFKKNINFSEFLNLPLLLIWQFCLFPFYFMLYHKMPSFFWMLLILERPLYFLEAKHHLIEGLLEHYSHRYRRFDQLQYGVLFYRLALLGVFYFISRQLFWAVILVELFDAIIYFSYRFLIRPLCCH